MYYFHKLSCVERQSVAVTDWLQRYSHTENKVQWRNYYINQKNYMIYINSSHIMHKIDVLLGVFSAITVLAEPLTQHTHTAMVGQY